MSFVKNMLSGKKSEPVSDPTMMDRMNQQAEAIIERIPALVQLRTFARDLQETRDLWAVVIPLLIIVGWDAYRKERRRVLYDRAARRLLAQQLEEQQQTDNNLPSRQ